MTSDTNPAGMPAEGFGETTSYSHCPRCGQTLKGTSGSCLSCGWLADRASSAKEQPPGVADIARFQGALRPVDHAALLHQALEHALPLLKRQTVALEAIAEAQRRPRGLDRLMKWLRRES